MKSYSVIPTPVHLKVRKIMARISYYGITSTVRSFYLADTSCFRPETLWTCSTKNHYISYSFGGISFWGQKLLAHGLTEKDRSNCIKIFLTIFQTMKVFQTYELCLINNELSSLYFQAHFTHVKQNGLTSSVVITSFSGLDTGLHSVSGIRSAGWWFGSSLFSFNISTRSS